MTPEVVQAINYASGHFVMLNELHDKVGERIASLLQCEAAMVTSGAASALTLGTAGVLTGTDRQKIADLPNLANMKSEVIVQKAHRLGYEHAIRNCGVRLIEVETPEAARAGDHLHTAMMFFYNNNNREGQIPDVEFVRPRQEARRPHAQRRGGGRAAGREPLEVHEDGVRPRGLPREGRACGARRVPASCSGASPSSRRPA